MPDLARNRRRLDLVEDTAHEVLKGCLGTYAHTAGCLLYVFGTNASS